MFTVFNDIQIFWTEIRFLAAGQYKRFSENIGKTQNKQPQAFDCVNILLDERLCSLSNGKTIKLSMKLTF